MLTILLFPACSTPPEVQVVVQGFGDFRGERDCEVLTSAVVTSADQAEELWPENATWQVPVDMRYAGNTVVYAEAEGCDQGTELRVTEVAAEDNAVVLTVAAGYPEGGMHPDEIVNPFLLGYLEGAWSVEVRYAGHVGRFE